MNKIVFHSPDQNHCELCSSVLKRVDFTTSLMWKWSLYHLSSLIKPLGSSDWGKSHHRLSRVLMVRAGCSLIAPFLLTLMTAVQTPWLHPGARDSHQFLTTTAASSPCSVCVLCQWGFPISEDAETVVCSLCSHKKVFIVMSDCALGKILTKNKPCCGYDLVFQRWVGNMLTSQIFLYVGLCDVIWQQNPLFNPCATKLLFSTLISCRIHNNISFSCS